MISDIGQNWKFLPFFQYTFGTQHLTSCLSGSHGTCQADVAQREEFKGWATSASGGGHGVKVEGSQGRQWGEGRQAEADGAGNSGEMRLYIGHT